MIIPPSVGVLLARGEGDSDAITGMAEVLIKIPNEGRVISGGTAYFSDPEPGDYLSIDIKDVDDVFGYGAGAIVGSFDDQLVPVANQGWYVPLVGYVDLLPIVSNDPRDLAGVGGLYLSIKGYRKIPANTATLYVNVRWGKRIR